LCTPNDQHCPQAIAAASAGKHVFCEKPMARSVTDCKAMIAAADNAGVCLMVGHMQRLRPEYAAMAQVVRSGDLGRLRMASIEGFFYREPTSWWARESIGGGLLAFVAVHDIDFLNYIGGDVTRVYAAAPPKIDDKTDYVDAIGVVMVFQSGAIASLTSSWRFPPLDLHDSRAVRLVLDGGSVYYDPLSDAVEVRAVGGPVQRMHFDRAISFDQAYRTEIANFAAWINGDSAPLLTGLDGLRCVEVMEAADRSVATGQPINLARSS
jgi:UDP-N-acetylglucosamine 3-dehydrogenase